MLRVAWLGLCCSLVFGAALSPHAARADSSAPVAPFEMATWPIAATPLDDLVTAGLAKHGYRPAFPCTDEVFVRRVYIDLIGTLPTIDDLHRFQADKRPDKRAALIDALMARPEFVELWTLKWCDLLRLKAEFPINLWPNAVQCYERWIHDAVRSNMPFDQFARALLTSSGSNFREGPSNFMRAVQSREPGGIAQAVALTFLGSRIETWPAVRRAGLAAFYSRLKFKSTSEWKEQVVILDPEPEVVKEIGRASCRERV